MAFNGARRLFLMCRPTSVLLLLLSSIIAGAAPVPTNVDVPTVALKGSADFSVSVGLEFPVLDATILVDSDVFYIISLGGDVVSAGSFLAAEDGVLATSLDLGISPTKLGAVHYTVEFSDVEGEAGESTTFTVQVIPEALTLLPPAVTLVVAIATRNVLWSLFGGVYFASLLVYNYDVVTAFIRTFDTFIVEAYADVGHIYIIIFSSFLAGMVAVIIKNGGGYGLAEAIAKHARSARAGALATMAVGVIIFFDDYANTLIVGQTMRAFTDSLLISREKLSFLVDATSAPIASLSPVSSWIGFEIGLIGDALDSIEASGEDVSCYDSSAFIIFVKTIPSRFYPFFILVVQFLLIVSGRELGPMLKAERRARRTGKVWSDSADLSQTEVDESLEPEEWVPRLWWNAILPIFITIFVVLLAMGITGANACEDAGISKSAQNIFGNADSFGALLWGSFLGSVTAWVLSWLHRVSSNGRLTHAFSKVAARPILSFAKSLEVWIQGIKGLTTAVMILIMAWSIGSAFTACGTGEYVASALSGALDGGAYPVLTFVISLILAAITGTSWGTMAIMFPLVLPAAHQAAPCDKAVFYGTISSILSGAVCGDHCSPISDTTVMTAMACKCDLQDHVKTQIPYAMLAAAVGIVIGDIPSGYGSYPDWVGLLLGIVVTGILTMILTVPVEGGGIDPISRGLGVLKGFLSGGEASSGDDGDAGIASVKQSADQEAAAVAAATAAPLG